MLSRSSTSVFYWRVLNNFQDIRSRNRPILVRAIPTRAAEGALMLVHGAVLEVSRVWTVPEGRRETKN
jgi:hypothetical protein